MRVIFWVENGSKRVQTFESVMKANQFKVKLAPSGITKFTTMPVAKGTFINTKSHLALTQTAL